MKILVSYRAIPQSPGWATGDLVVKAFRALGHEVYSYAKYYQENRWVEDKPLLDDHEWDLILFMECNDGDPQYPELRIVRARKTACWLFDTSYHKDRYTKLVNYFGFDHHFLANPSTIQEYKVWGYTNVHYLSYACDRELHGRPLEHPKTRDVVLVGSIRDDRRALSIGLARHNINLELIDGVFREEYIDALASARIVVNQNPTEGRGLLNMRWFESIAAGAMIFGEASDLKPNEDTGLWCFGSAYGYHSINGLAEMIKTYCAADSIYEMDRKQLQHNAFTFNTYQNRCKTILETIFPHERN